MQSEKNERGHVGMTTKELHVTFSNCNLFDDQ